MTATTTRAGRPTMTKQPPGPGIWSLDAAHCERPHSRFVIGLDFADIFTRGMRATAERYGLMLDTVEARFVDGFIYTSPRPLGAPPDASGPPPKLLVQLLSRLHPTLRARVRRADEVLRTKVWREDVAEFRGPYTTRMRDRLQQAQRKDLVVLEDEALFGELQDLAVLASEDLFEHFRTSGACMFPVGDFIVQTMQWTGCAFGDALAVLTGSSPDSIDAVTALATAAAAVADCPAAVALLSSSTPPVQILTGLPACDPTVGAAVGTWLDLVAERIVTGHDVAELRAIEMPGTLVDALRERVRHPAGTGRSVDPGARQAAEAALREKVPAASRAAFDGLLLEAKEAHPLRDARSAFDFWVMGILRRALLEAGRRLSARGLLEAADHAVDCTLEELGALFAGRGGPAASEVAIRVTRRRALSCSDMPDHLGGTPRPPPPSSWFPAGAARIAAAFTLYLDASFREGQGPREQARVTGVPASSGRCRGRARVVDSALDFARVQQGDILVARITSPAYNVLLPLLSGLVTERGGVLSHPAIVSREYGIPGVVGARGALELIADGDTIEVDGDAGVVRVLS